MVLSFIKIMINCRCLGFLFLFRFCRCLLLKRPSSSTESFEDFCWLLLMLLLTKIVIEHFKINLNEFGWFRIGCFCSLGLLPLCFHLTYWRLTQSIIKFTCNFGESTNIRFYKSLLFLIISNSVSFISFRLLPSSGCSHGTFLWLNYEFTPKDGLAWLKPTLFVLRLPILLLLNFL
jgi:hypothetical protein